MLLVEGENDKYFFKNLLCKLGYTKEQDNAITINVATPRDENAGGNGKPNAIKKLDDILPNLADENYKTSRLAMILDADTETKGWGKRKTIEKVAEKLSQYGYSNTNPDVSGNGYIFENTESDMLHPVGLWVMTRENHNEGCLEDWLKEIIQEDNLFLHAKDTVKNLPEKRMKTSDFSKAEMATYLAWQKKPDLQLESLVKDNLLDMQSPSFLAFQNWLTTLYPKN